MRRTIGGFKMLSDAQLEEVKVKLEGGRLLQDIITNENKHKPLNDEALVKVLHNAGYNVARRTVAKYREQSNIPVARLRREL